MILDSDKWWIRLIIRGGICPCRQCQRQCKIFASGVNFSIFTHFLCFFLLKLLKLGEIDGVKFLAWKSGGVKFWTNSMSDLQWTFLYDSALFCLTMCIFCASLSCLWYFLYKKNCVFLSDKTDNGSNNIAREVTTWNWPPFLFKG